MSLVGFQTWLLPWYTTEEHLVTLKDLEQTYMDERKRARRNQVMTYPIYSQSRSLNVAH